MAKSLIEKAKFITLTPKFTLRSLSTSPIVPSKDLNPSDLSMFQKSGSAASSTASSSASSFIDQYIDQDFSTSTTITLTSLRNVDPFSSVDQDHSFPTSRPASLSSFLRKLTIPSAAKEIDSSSATAPSSLASSPLSFSSSLSSFSSYTPNSSVPTTPGSQASSSASSFIEQDHSFPTSRPASSFFSSRKLNSKDHIKDTDEPSTTDSSVPTTPDSQASSLFSLRNLLPQDHIKDTNKPSSTGSSVATTPGSQASSSASSFIDPDSAPSSTTTPVVTKGISRSSNMYNLHAVFKKDAEPDRDPPASTDTTPSTTPGASPEMLLSTLAGRLYPQYATTELGVTGEHPPEIIEVA